MSCYSANHTNSLKDFCNVANKGMLLERIIRKHSTIDSLSPEALDYITKSLPTEKYHQETKSSTSTSDRPLHDYFHTRLSTVQSD